MLKLFIYLVLLCFMPVMIYAKPGNDSLYEKHVFIHGKDTLPYRLLRPVHINSGKKYPLIIFLHGSGERGTDNEKQLIHGTRLFADSIKEYPCFVIVPQCPEGQRWAEMDWSAVTPVQAETISRPLTMTNQLVDRLVQELPADKNRIYLTGLSMGGQGVWDFLYRYPEKFAAAIPVCGTADTRIAPVIKGVPVWCFHGEKDDVVPFIAAENLVKALQSAGGKPLFTPYPEVGHNAWDFAYKESLLLHWLFSQKLK